MPEPYPIPSYACNLWVAGDDLWIAFPGQGPEGRGHSIKLPASATGLKVAIDILRERAQAERLEIGNRGTPTQYEVEAGKAWGKVTKRLREEHEADITAKIEEKAAAARRKARAEAKAKAQAEAELAELGL